MATLNNQDTTKKDIPEREVVEEVYDVVCVVLVLLPEVLQDADLLLRLPVEALLVAHHLHRHVVVLLVVVRLHHLRGGKGHTLILILLEEILNIF